MFGREFKAAEHRRHIPPTQRVGYGVEPVNSRTADRWLLDDLAEMAGLSTRLSNGWEILQTNGGGPVLFREFNDYDSGKVSPPDSPGGPWNWSVHARLYQVNVGSGAANTAEEAMSMVEQTYAEYKRTASRKTAAVTWYDQSDQFGGMWSTYQGSAPDSPNGQISESNGTYRWYVSDSGTRGNQQTGESSSLDEAKREAESALASLGVTASRTASHRTAFLDTVHFAEPRHRVAGWDWDDHLNGFIAAEAAREFTCSCGDNIPAPGYTDCRCGKRWNAYTIQANGSKKMIAREVPVRENVVMAGRTASRKQAAEPSVETPYGTLVLDSPVIMLDDEDMEDVGTMDLSNPQAILESYADYLDQAPPVTFPEFYRGASRKTASDASYEGWTARIVYDEDDFEYAETTTPSGERADSIYPMDGSHFEGGELREALEELAREWGDDAYSGTYQYNSHRQAAIYHITQVQQDPGIVKPGDLIATDSSRGRVHKILPPDGMGIMVIMMEDGGRLTLRTSARKQAAPSSGADAIAQHFPGWRVDDENGNFWEIHSPGGEHAFIHEENGTYTVLTNDNTPDEFWETGLTFDEALEEMRAEGVITARRHAASLDTTSGWNIQTRISGQDYIAKNDDLGVWLNFVLGDDGSGPTDKVLIFTKDSGLGGFNLERFGGSLNPASVRKFIENEMGG